MAAATTLSEKLDLRLTPAAKSTLKRAAAAAQRSASEYVLESALERAGEALIERRRFGLDGAQRQAFLTALDAPTRHHPRLERLLQEPGLFDDAPTP